MGANALSGWVVFLNNRLFDILVWLSIAGTLDESLPVRWLNSIRDGSSQASYSKFHRISTADT